MIKPDGVQRGYIGQLIDRFEKKGFKLLAMKLYKPAKETLEEHYQDLKERPFFKDLINNMLMGPVVCMVWQGLQVIKTGRTMLGATNPLNSAPGTIRGDYNIETRWNCIHGSDSVESAEREIKLWFKDDEIHKYFRDCDKWIYEKPFL